MTQRTVIAVQMCAIAPTLYFFHGLAHIQGADGIASLLVYAIKLSYCVVIIDAFLRGGFKLNIGRHKWVLNVTLGLLVTGTVAAVFHSNFISLFYFIADFVGLAVLPFYILILIRYFQLHERGPNEAIHLMQLSVIVTAIYLIIYFVLSDAQKISTPPDVQAALTAVIAASILRVGTGSRIRLITSVVAVVVIIALAQLRMLIIVGGLAFLLSAIRLIVTRFGVISLIRAMTMVVLSLGLLIIFGGEMVEERIKTLPIVGEESSLVTDGIGDDSTNQRFVEASQVFEQMNENWTSYLFGMGYGALYENTLVLNSHYNLFQHHLHASPVAILFRMGVFALIVYFAIAYLAIKLMLSRSDIHFIAGIVLFMQWLSSLMDLYLFWGFSFSLSIAFALYVNAYVPVVRQNRFVHK